MNDIMTIIKKELSRFFQDKKLLFTTIILPGLMLYIMYTLMGSVISGLMVTDESYVYQVTSINTPEVLKDYFKELPIQITEEKMENLTRVKEQVGTEMDACIVFPQDFEQEVAVYSVGSKMAAPTVEIYYSSGENTSLEAENMLTEVLDAYENSIANKFDIKDGEEYDLREGSDLSMQYMYSVIPMLIILFLFSGCVSIAPDFVAGEKERGTMATLLVTPVKRSAIAIGKVVSMSIVSILSAVSSFIGMMLSLPKMQMNISLDGLGAMDYMKIGIVLVVTALTLISLLVIISTQASSVKEAGTYSSSIMVLIMVLAIAGGYMSGGQSKIGTYFIPVLNSSRCIAGVFCENLDAGVLFYTVLSNVVITVLMIIGITKMFESEKIIFSKK